MGCCELSTLQFALGLILSLRAALAGMSRGHCHHGMERWHLLVLSQEASNHFIWERPALPETQMIAPGYQRLNSPVILASDDLMDISSTFPASHSPSLHP